MTIVADDFHYSTTSSGKEIKYGEAGDCYSASKASCRKGKFKIDLTGTGFRLKVSFETRLYPYAVYMVLHFLDFISRIFVVIHRGSVHDYDAERV